MSHFTVLVVTTERPTDDVLTATLLPFHEYECTGIEAYTQFVAYDQVELRADYEKYADEGDSFEVFLKGWYGDHVHQNAAGEWGRITNPNKKWDWWTVGGRWSGLLLTTAGEKTDTCQKRDLNLAAMADARYGRRVASWDEYQQDLARRGTVDADADRGVRYWNGIPEGVNMDTYLATDPGFTTFAMLKDGRWCEKGKMGWFAMVADEKADWPQTYQHLFNSIPDEAWLTVVDCHI